MAKMLFDFYSKLLEGWTYVVELETITISISDMFLNLLVMSTIGLIMYCVFYFVYWLLKSIKSGWGWFE